ncbi:MAG: hypothetical protein ACK41E_02770 [Deinococcales bacterium]
MTDTELLQPQVPLATYPRNFVELERYSSVKRFWDLLSGCHKNGFLVEVPSRSNPAHCRRAITGLVRHKAGSLHNDAALISALQEDEDLSLEVFNLSSEARAAIQQLLEGYRAPFVEILSNAYRLEFDVQLAFTARRELLLKASAQYVPLPQTDPPFPFATWKLEPIRWRRDDYKVLLERAASGLLQ